jgi:hypothetical protein
LRKSSLDNDKPRINCVKQASHTWATPNLSTAVIRMTTTIKEYLNRPKGGELSLLDKEKGSRTKFTTKEKDLQDCRCARTSLWTICCGQERRVDS